MTMEKRWMGRLCAVCLTTLIAFEPFTAFLRSAEAEAAAPASQTESATPQSRAKYYAFAKVAVKVRRQPDKSAGAPDSIAKGATVYILDFVNDEWALVVTERTEGYVQRQYLLNETEVLDTQAVPEKAADLNALMAESVNFREAYQAFAYEDAAIRDRPDDGGRWIDTALKLDKVIVSSVEGDWCYARYGKTYGYIRCHELFKWDRLVADAGVIPGLDILPLMLFVKRSANVYSLEDNSVLATVNPGGGVAAFDLDAFGRYTLPYWRTTGYINAEDVASVVRVQDYETAQPGDLISVMTTFYALGVSTLQFQGRNWNIHLAASMITGYVLQPGEDYDQYQVIGPYRKSTGYHSAPIMKKGALSGYGGGTCQVNTTFYVTNIQLPIVVTHRKVHADVGTYYVKVGLDAAVGGGDINLTLTNTMPYAIRYHFFDSDGVLTCCIYRES